jgi:hypothetical protein
MPPARHILDHVAARCRGSLPLNSKFVSIVCPTRMVSTRDTGI